MKKSIFFFLTCLMFTGAYAQVNNEASNIDWQEDSTELVSIKDIIKEQQALTTRNMNDMHLKDIWSRKSYLNLSFLNTTMTPQADILTTGPLNGGLIVPELKSKWGLSLQAGRSYRLLPEPIANMVQFYIDYTFIDLTFNYFKEGDKIPGTDYRYDSSEKTSEDYYYMPWNLKKYEASFGMSIGPSLSVCPFYYINVKSLHFVKLNFYYHIGYHVSGIMMQNDEDADQNQATGYTTQATDHKQMKDNLKAELGHGIMNSIGFSLTWKGIGLGFEHRTAKLKYKPLSSSDFGKDEAEFKNAMNRVFIQFRM